MWAESDRRDGVLVERRWRSTGANTVSVLISRQMPMMYSQSKRGRVDNIPFIAALFREEGAEGAKSDACGRRIVE